MTTGPTKFFILFCTFIFHCYPSEALAFQQRVNIKSDSLQFATYLDSIAFYQYKNYPKAYDFEDAALALAKKMKDEHRVAQVRTRYAWTLIQDGGKDNFDMAKEQLDMALEVFEKKKDSAAFYSCINRFSILYKEKKEYSKALEYAMEFLAYKERVHDNSEKSVWGTASAYNSIANIYLELKLFDLAITNHQKAYQLLKKANLSYQYLSLANIGLDFHAKEDWEQCILYHKKALVGFEKNNQVPFMGMAYANIADSYDRWGKFEQAIDYTKKALDLKQRGTSLEISLSNLSLYYLHAEQLDSALHYANKVLENLDFQPSLSVTVRALNVKSEVFEKRGDSKAALVYSRQANRLNDSLEALKNIPEAVETLLSAAEAEKTNAIKDFQKKLSLRNKSFLAITVLTLFLGALSFYILRKNNAKLGFLQKRERHLNQELQAVSGQKDHLQREITVTVANLATRNEVLQEVQLILNQIVAREKLNSRTKSKLSLAKDKISDNLQLSRLWHEFFKHFNGVHQDFIALLTKKYRLSETEVKICCFLKMGLTNNEIATILNIEVNSLNQSVYRIKKKLDLSGKTRVVEFLQTI